MTRWHAVSSIEDAFEETYRILFKPVDVRFWLRLALVVFLISGFGLDQSLRITDAIDSDNLGGGAVLIIILVLLLLVCLILVMAYVSSVFSFVFVDAVLEGKVSLTEGFKKNAVNGLKYLLFKVAAALVSAVLFAVALLPLIVLVLLAIKAETAIIVALAVFGIFYFIVVAVVFSIIGGLVYSFTNDFILPIMIQGKRGLLTSWSNLYNLIHQDFWQFLVYVIVKFGLGIVRGIILLVVYMLFFLVALLVFFVIALPFIFLAVLVNAVGVGLSDIVSNTPLLVVLVVAGVMAFMVFNWVFSYAIILATLPVHVFFRLYSIIFLNKLDPVKETKKSPKRGGKDINKDEPDIRVY